MMTLKDPSEGGFFKNILGKAENADYQHFSLPKMSSILSETNFNLYVTFILSSAKAFNLDHYNFFHLIRG